MKKNRLGLLFLLSSSLSWANPAPASAVLKNDRQSRDVVAFNAEDLRKELANTTFAIHAPFTEGDTQSVRYYIDYFDKNGTFSIRDYGLNLVLKAKGNGKWWVKSDGQLCSAGVKGKADHNVCGFIYKSWNGNIVLAPQLKGIFDLVYPDEIWVGKGNKVKEMEAYVKCKEMGQCSIEPSSHK